NACERITSGNVQATWTKRIGGWLDDSTPLVIRAGTIRAARHPRRNRALANLLPDPLRHLGDAEPLLGHRIAIADGHRLVLERFVVDRNAKRRPDFVLPPVAPANVPGFVVINQRPGGVLD